MDDLPNGYYQITLFNGKMVGSSVVIDLEIVVKISPNYLAEMKSNGEFDVNKITDSNVTESSTSETYKIQVIRIFWRTAISMYDNVGI